MSWSREWIKSLTRNEAFQPYPLQFANVDRIENNRAVYIFDEVGTGKTVSAGLMALHYLYNHPGKNVLAITLNALVVPCWGYPQGKFLGEWLEKLPFESLDLDKRVSVINNVYSNIEKQSGRNIGLLIIDEAHLFLRRDIAAQRIRHLRELNAERVVFLTATPVKYGFGNLSEYGGLARAILGQETSDPCGAPIGGDSAICAVFDPESPVTRYFKDTVKALEYVRDGEIDFEKKIARRQTPELWEYTGDKIDDLLRRLRKLHENEQDPPHRFLIFTRYVRRESEQIAKKMAQDPAFALWDGQPRAGKLTYASVYGGSERHAGEFKHNGSERPLPDVLIITCGIGEQGIDLPGYDYVINYHIPANPAALEQRFGRIDRMGQSRYPEIHMACMIPKEGWDNYSGNYYSAMWIYLYALLTSFPTKNVLLTEEQVKKCQAAADWLRERYERLRKLCEDDGAMQMVAGLLAPEADSTAANEDARTLAELCGQYAEECGEELTGDAESVRRIARKALDALNRDVRSLRPESRESIPALSALVREIGDKIFYIREDGGGVSLLLDGKDPLARLKTMDAIRDDAHQGCAEQIYRSPAYQHYLERFRKELEGPMLFQRWSGEIEAYFEECFLAPSGTFESVMNNAAPARLMRERILPWLEERLRREDREPLCEEHRNLLISHAGGQIPALPFYHMCRIFREQLLYCCGYDRFDRNPFMAAYGKTLWRIRWESGAERLAERMESAYQDTEGGTVCSAFDYKVFRRDGQTIIAASPWHKLAYRLLRLPEGADFMGRQGRDARYLHLMCNGSGRFRVHTECMQPPCLGGDVQADDAWTAAICEVKAI